MLRQIVRMFPRFADKIKPASAAAVTNVASADTVSCGHTATNRTTAAAMAIESFHSGC